jgi:hypothetical protein
LRAVSTKIFWPLLIGLLLVAFWLRLDRLDTLPPGVSNDESTNTVDAFTINQTGRLPLYEDITRPEHLYRVILAVGVRFLGPGVWSFRVINVFIALLTLSAAYWVTRECVHDQPPPVRAVAGLAAAASLGVSLPYVVLSRSIYRGPLEALCVLLFVGFLVRGLRTGRWRGFILGGVALGLSLHSYTAALSLPAALPVVALSLLIFRFKAWRTWLPNLVVLAAVLAVLAAPIGWLVLTDSERVLSRASNVSGGQTSITQRNLANLWDQFFRLGDINPQYDADRAPLLPPVFDLLFAAGLAALLLRIRQPSSALIAALLVLAAIPVLAGREIPHGLRIVGEFAAFPLAIGAGTASLLALAAYLPRPTVLKTAAPVAMVAALLVVTANDAVAARQRYLRSWDQTAHLYWKVYGRELKHGDWFFRTDHRDLGRWLAAEPGPLLVPLDVLDQSTTRTWLLRAYPKVATAGDTFQLPAVTRLVVPWALELGDLRRDTREYGLLNDGTITLLPPLAADAHAALLADIDRAQEVRRANGDLLARVRLIPPEMAVTFEPRTATAYTPPLATFDGNAKIVGWRGPDTLAGVDAQTVDYTLDWAAAHPANHYYSAVVQLRTQSYEGVAGDEGPIWRWLFNPTQWQPRDVIPALYVFDVPANLPPGAYRLVVGVYLGPFTDKRVPARSVVAPPVQDLATVGWIKVPQPAVPPRPDVLPLEATLGDLFALRGASASVAGEGEIRLTLTWEALVRRPAIDATVFVHVLGADNRLVTQDDARPWGGQYPTFIWDAGERVQTEHLLAVGDAPLAELRLVAGMYTFPGPVRLPVVQHGSAAADQLADLGPLDVLLTTSGR